MNPHQGGHIPGNGGPGSHQDGFQQYIGYLDQVALMDTQTMTLDEAKRHASSLPGCAGFTFNGAPDQIRNTRTTVFFQKQWAFGPSSEWTSFKRLDASILPPPPLPAAADTLLLPAGTITKFRCWCWRLSWNYASSRADGAQPGYCCVDHQQKFPQWGPMPGGQDWYRTYLQADGVAMFENRKPCANHCGRAHTKDSTLCCGHCTKGSSAHSDECAKEWTDVRALGGYFHFEANKRLVQQEAQEPAELARQVAEVQRWQAVMPQSPPEVGAPPTGTVVKFTCWCWRPAWNRVSCFPDGQMPGYCCIDHQREFPQWGPKPDGQDWYCTYLQSDGTAMFENRKPCVNHCGRAHMEFSNVCCGDCMKGGTAHSQECTQEWMDVRRFGLIGGYCKRATQ